MLPLEEQEQFVNELQEIESKLYDLLQKHEKSLAIAKFWCMIYDLLLDEKTTENKLREKTQS